METSGFELDHEIAMKLCRETVLRYRVKPFAQCIHNTPEDDRPTVRQVE